MAPHSLLSVADFKADKKVKLPILEVRVYKKVDEYSYKVRDNSGKGVISVMKNPALGKKLGLGMCVRLVNPLLEGQSILLQRAPLMIPPIVLHEDNASDDDGEDHHEDADSDDDATGDWGGEVQDPSSRCQKLLKE